MAEQNDDILNTWRDLGEKIDKMKTGIEELKRERRSVVVTFIEQKKNLLEQAAMVIEERPGSPKAITALKLPQPWDNYYYSDGLFYTRTLIGNASSGDRPLLRQIGEGETDVLLGGSNLIEILAAIRG
ncbi:MAG: hypothetical protein A2131_02785 [Candidatus Sungbacteria bacterium GWC2_49_10]|uniref:Uncharacterized protein n=2 Tax=Parcubacteria group TaxID=1794811 RepID=A0A0G1WPB8_9BACT|nr:MAG: hypothetical protein UY60_C0002G0001 [Parcubacteria group bacterium GW2011_GWB1_50_9]KKW20663.1 MAG: hypothetical protein UY61_C0026G0012 [Candidatus Adlerbacteria bacterium GW2011_GWC1_50_9]OGZ93315.1 MAG: hypothetical protein A2131_02785 [Candidatus Sungbacteria bacterium GWC2_49_10]